jgi:RimJ/RimL family protein N-acetyltransferase
MRRRTIARVGVVDPPRSQAIVVDGRAVGGVGLELMTDVNRRSAEIGYWLGVDYWGRGIATEAVTLVTTWAFGAHGLLRIFAQPFAENRGSRRVLEKAGYALEGTMRRSAVKDGGVARPVPVRPPLRVLRACGPCRSLASV